jgi:hypothetical protein
MRDGDARYFNLQSLIYAVADGLEKWAGELNGNPTKTSALFQRYDRVLSDVRYEVWSHDSAEESAEKS